MLRLLATKCTVIVNAPKEVAYDALLAACKDAGAPFIRFNDVDDPDGVAAIIRSAVRGSHSTMRKAKTDAPAAEPKKPICPACGYLNTADAKFCSQCGSKI